MGLSGHGIPSGIVPFVPVVCGASYHLLGYRISQDSKIRFRLQVESYISDWLFSELRLLASYVSRHKAMAYDIAPAAAKVIDFRCKHKDTTKAQLLAS